jgi:Spy/CpxP family protein refolding chaperone
VEETAMPYRSVLFSIIALSLVLCFTSRAGDDDGKKAKHKGYVAFVLAHATDLSLTDDQKTKLTALADADKPPADADKDKIKEHNKEIHAKVGEILTKEQKDKLKDLAPNKKAAGGDKAPEEKKDEKKETKTEEKKDDANNNMGGN